MIGPNYAFLAASEKARHKGIAAQWWTGRARGSVTMLGKTHWVIPEGFIPAAGPYPENRALRSHETACLLNTGFQAAHVRIQVYFKDRDPVGPFSLTVEPQRTLHLRFDELEDPEPLPRETDYASVLESDVPIIVQHTRLDARLGSLSLMSSIAYGAD